MTKDICREDLAECWSRRFILAGCKTLLLRQSANLRILVRWPCARLQDVGEQCPDGSRPVCAGPAANASVPHDSVKLLPTLEQLLRQRLDTQFEMVTIPPTGLEYAPDFQLRDCIEGNIAFDGSPLARAAKFAQREDQMGVTWCIVHVPLLNSLLDAAQAEIQT